MPQPIFPNGINGSTGQSLDNFQLTTEQLAIIARQERPSADELREAKQYNAHEPSMKDQR